MIHIGDLFDVLPTLPEASVDACVTDPPYGLQFMGKEWDRLWRNERAADVERQKRVGGLAGRRLNLPDYTASNNSQMQQWHERWAREVLRVLKPGAHLAAFGGTRTFHRMTCAIEDAGFEIRDCLSWLYGQGFPKSLNIGDGRGTALKPSWEPIMLARKPTEGTVKANIHGRFGQRRQHVE